MISVFVGRSLAQGMFDSWLYGSMLQDVAESLWKGSCILWLES